MNISGIFTCTVTNSLGSAHKNFSVVVKPTVIYHPWSEWSDCRAPCDSDGLQYRIRHCEVKSKISAPLNCENSYEVRPCQKTCWSDWTRWSACPRCKSHANNSVEQSRFRTCVANSCSGKSSETRECDIEVCPAEVSGWSDWGDWKGCPSCKKEHKVLYDIRRRTCLSTDLSTCKGKSTETKECEILVCDESGWAPWSDWTKCPDCFKYKTAKPRRRRFRTCAVADASKCQSNNEEFEPCNIEYCITADAWGQWSEWSNCVVSAPGACWGYQTRLRNCEAGKNKCTGGAEREYQRCRVNEPRCNRI